LAGGSPEHAALASALTITIGAQLRGRPCRVHSSDLRVRLLATGLATYPDVTVICGQVQLDPDDPRRHTVTNPTVLCEVLSPSTADYDRGEKLDGYKLVPSVRHVVLVAFDQRSVEVWSRHGAADWTRQLAGAGERVHLAAIGVELGVDELYSDPLSPAGDLVSAGFER
jgi:Uma2 family endonuclease